MKYNSNTTFKGYPKLSHTQSNEEIDDLLNFIFKIINKK